MLPLGISAAQLAEQGVNCGWIEGVNQPQLLLLVSGATKTSGMLWGRHRCVLTTGSNPILIEGGSKPLTALDQNEKNDFDELPSSK